MRQDFAQTVVVGVGLLGGSVGLAAKKAGVGGKIIGFGRSEAKLRRAVELGAVDAFATDWRAALELGAGTQGTTQIVFAAPVETNLRVLRDFCRVCGEIGEEKGADAFAGRAFLLSDVGSVKGDFVRTVDALLSSPGRPSGVRLDAVAAHPIAGSDKSGAEFATADLFRGKLTILTPWESVADRRAALERGEAVADDAVKTVVNGKVVEIEQVDEEKNVEENNVGGDKAGKSGNIGNVDESENIGETVGIVKTGLNGEISRCVAGEKAEAVAAVRAFWEALGSTVVETSADEHDRILARTSHLPHLASVLTASVVPTEELLFTGTGFRDVTRLAGGAPDVWVEIFGSNRAATLDALELLEEKIVLWKSFLKENDRESILTFLKETKKKRDALGS
ncbi:MAG: prephenate dehydrogenase/arogenate dehydrogenase family protein [Thermoguttaceae bacterium]|nr:prephenate dehydrogenase/arogenate dehydrogenase family protein [Thermoguttaceae bacterium]